MDISSSYFAGPAALKQDYYSAADISEGSNARWTGQFFPHTSDVSPMGYRSMVDEYYQATPYYSHLPPVYCPADSSCPTPDQHPQGSEPDKIWIQPDALSHYQASQQEQLSRCGVPTLPYGYTPTDKSRRNGGGSKKERRRTISINGAFSNLRDCIPNVPKDTKLSKIKTLRLACGYIKYLMEVLENDGQMSHEFKADLSRKTPCRAEKRKSIEAEIAAAAERKARGRSGWPQAIWAKDLKHENNNTINSGDTVNSNHSGDSAHGHVNGYTTLKLSTDPNGQFARSELNYDNSLASRSVGAASTDGSIHTDTMSSTSLIGEINGTENAMNSATSSPH